MDQTQALLKVLCTLVPDHFCTTSMVVDSSVYLISEENSLWQIDLLYQSSQ